MNILLLGNGGREHAIARAIAASPYLSELYISPGNSGTAQCGENVSLATDDEILNFCLSSYIELVVIGDPAYLVRGLADKIRELNIAVVGPNQNGAMLEGSKIAAKRFMESCQIPTPAYKLFESKEELSAFVANCIEDNSLCPWQAGCVLKEDTLSVEGQGTRIFENLHQLQAQLPELKEGGYVLEEYVSGIECSYLTLVDETHVLPLALSQDHKRISDGCTGVNTAGMGAYSPVPCVSPEDERRMLELMRQAWKGIKDAGITYRGVLYGGFIITSEGPVMLEFNVRFGDPETQAVLPRLKSDFIELMVKCSEGRLNELMLYWLDSWTVSVVLAAPGYPEAAQLGGIVRGIDDAWKFGRVHVYHGGLTKTKDGEFKINSGRVLTITALGDSFEEARERAYKAADCIQFDGKLMRSDIGYQVQRFYQQFEQK